MEGSLDSSRVAVTGVTMGYGHLRASHAVAGALGAEVWAVDRAPHVGRLEGLTWSRVRGVYDILSRLATNRGLAPPFRRALDRLTAVERDSGGGAVGVLDELVRMGLGRTLAESLDRDGRTLVCAFYATAIAVERYGRAPVCCIVTDTDIHRVWAPREPAATRIRYLVPGDTAARRLRGFGVPAERITITGFPLPQELVGSRRRELLEANLARRLERLTGRSGDPPTLVFAVGGAGAQSRRALELLRALRPLLIAGRLRLVLVAGTRERLARRFERWVRTVRAPETEVLFEPTFAAYYRRFNRRLANADLLWTKPGELVFYAALGLPVILDDPVGSHELSNRHWLEDAGAGLRRPRIPDAAEWLDARLGDGALAEAASLAASRLPSDGTGKVLQAVLHESLTRT